ncbi:MAG: DNA-directed RNA polymerase subunit alpha [Gemmatimonadales bacterium]
MPETVEETKRSEDGARVEFVLQPLERGFGHTIGNSIRRILLSSLPGAAVWAFRADGVQHEHQTIDGVVEDIDQIIQKLNPELVLFTLQEDLPEGRPLRIDLWVNRGRGFLMADQHVKPEEFPVDMITIDSIYNPVLKANFTVHETRVGERTDFDRLAIDVETNGAIDPGTALRQGADIARAHLGYLTHIGSADRFMGEPATDGERIGLHAVEDELQGLLETPLEAFEEISVRSRNTLDKANIRTLGDVAMRSRDDMLRVDNFGEKSLEEVAEVLALHGLRFGMTFERGGDGTLYVADEVAGNGAGQGDEDEE